MPRSEQVISIFLASPGDVNDERSQYAEVVEEWNRSWSRHLGMRLEVIRWEDDAYPAVGEDAQDVINTQLPSKCDLFVGIMWTRFGTPTGRAGSGTEEEFNRAMARYRSSPGEVNILVYFKDSPISPSKIVPEQLAAVQAFKRSLGPQGVLYWEIADSSQFDGLVRLHLTKHIQDLKNREVDQSRLAKVSASTTDRPPGASNESQLSTATPTEADDSGYLDTLEAFNEGIENMAAIAGRISDAHSRLTEHTNKGTAELNAIRADPSSLSPARARDALRRVAQEMHRFTESLIVEIPSFRQAADSSMNALTRLAGLVLEIYPEQQEATRDTAAAVLETVQHAREATEGFQRSTSDLPRMTKELNVAKRVQVSALNGLIAEYINVERLLAEALKVLSDRQQP